MTAPYYEDDYATLYHGDNRDIMPELPKVEAAIISDPPYGIGWDTNYSRFRGRVRGAQDKKQVAGDESPFDPASLLIFNEVILWGANHYAKELPPASWLIWDKRNKDGTAFLGDAEVAWWSHGHGVYIKSISAQWHRATAGGLHPTQKPVGLMHWCIQKVSADTILDPYSGSGTTLVAAKELQRRSIGIELEEQYCEIAARRLAAFEPLPFTEPETTEPEPELFE